MASWSLAAQLTSGTLTLAPTDRIWYNGTSFGDQIPVHSYQDSTHVTDASDVHRCTSPHVKNTKYLTNTTVSISGAASSALPISTGNCPWKFTFSDSSSVSTASAKFYGFDGATDSEPIEGATVQAAEGGVTGTWVSANGSGGALNLANQSASTSHDFYVAVSISPTSQGNKTGKFKLTITYI